MASVEKYYEILGVAPNATVQDLVRAYRKKAMQLHPDHNPAPDATQQFILLEEAYNYLKNLKEGKISPTGDRQYDDFVRWWAREQENTRRRAQERARMRYQEFVNSEEYKTETAIDHLTNVFFGCVAFGILVVIPLWATITNGLTGFLLSLLLAVITAPLTAPVLGQLGLLKESLQNFAGSIKYLLTFKWAQQLADAPEAKNFIFGVINLLVITLVVLNTLLSPEIILVVYGAAVLITYLITVFTGVKNRKLQKFYAFYIAPTLVSLLFVINFLFSSGLQTEFYRYEFDKNYVIVLENNAYNDYLGPRFFPMTHGIAFNNNIALTFEDGLFGIKVLKDFKLDWKEDKPFISDN